MDWGGHQAHRGTLRHPLLGNGRIRRRLLGRISNSPKQTARSRESTPFPSMYVLSTLSNSSQKAHRGFRRGRARHLRSNRDIDDISFTSTRLYSASTILQDRTLGRKIQNPNVAKRLHYVAQSMSNLAEELQELQSTISKQKIYKSNNTRIHS